MSSLLNHILSMFGLSPLPSRPINITTEYNKTFTCELNRKARIADVKKMVFNTYGLSERDQYYNTSENPTILDDKDKVWDKAPRDTLYLRTDEYLNLDELKKERKKLLKATGEKVISDPFSAIGASVVTAASQIGTNLHASASPGVPVDETAERRSELRRLKQADGRNEKTKNTFHGHSGLIPDVAHAAKNIYDLGRGAAEGVTRTGVDVTQMTQAYRRVGN